MIIIAGRTKATIGALSALGAVAATAAVAGGARIGLGARNPPDWWGLRGSSSDNPWAATLLIGGIVALAALWVFVIADGAGGMLRSARDVWLVAGCWALPFCVGIPLLSSDVYTYVGQGTLATRGLNPYSFTPLDLGSGSRVLAAIDPQWRGATSPYGPLATVMETVAVKLGGSVLGSVIVLRLVVIASVVVIALCAAEIAGPERRVTALAFVALNPLVLLQLVSAVHLEGPMVALAMAAIVAERRGHLLLAIALGCAAAAVKIPAIVVPVAVIVLAAYPAVRFRLLRRVALGAPLVATFVGIWLLFGALVSDGWGWVSGLETPTLGRTPSAPSTIASDILALILGFASRADIAVSGDLATAGVGLIVVICLLATARRRSLAHTVGLALLVICVSGPVIYPWYLLWALPLLGAISRPIWTARLALLSAAAATMQISGVSRLDGVMICLGVQLAWLFYGLSSGIVPWGSGSPQRRSRGCHRNDHLIRGPVQLPDSERAANARTLSS